MRSLFVKILVCILGIGCLHARGLSAASYQEMVMPFEGRPQTVHYDLYLPGDIFEQPSPVLICVGGLPIIDGQYVHSDTQECMTDEWTTFADQNNVAILGLGFLFVEEQWPTKTSYQYPAAWSATALLEILDALFQTTSIDPNQLYFYGISAGSQFVLRFAQMYPEISIAVAAHAAGGYDQPQDYISTKFLITVGEFDNDPITRREFAKLFAKSAGEKGIDVDLQIVPDIGHVQTEPQNEMSREFFKKILRERGGVDAKLVY